MWHILTDYAIVLLKYTSRNSAVLVSTVTWESLLLLPRLCMTVSGQGDFSVEKNEKNINPVLYCSILVISRLPGMILVIPAMRSWKYDFLHSWSSSRMHISSSQPAWLNRIQRWWSYHGSVISISMERLNKMTYCNSLVSLGYVHSGGVGTLRSWLGWFLCWRSRCGKQSPAALLYRFSWCQC